MGAFDLVNKKKQDAPASPPPAPTVEEVPLDTAPVKAAPPRPPKVEAPVIPAAIPAAIPAPVLRLPAPPAIPPEPPKPELDVLEIRGPGGSSPARVQNKPDPDVLAAREVALAANDVDTRARAEKLLSDKGVVGLLTDPASSNLTFDDIVSRRAQQIINQQEIAGKLPRPVTPRLGLSLDEKFAEQESVSLRNRAMEEAKTQAARDVATLRTVGMWSSTLLRGSGASAIDAMKPTEEVIGVDRKGQLVVRQQSPASYAMDVLQMPAYLAASTGYPDAMARTVMGESKGAYQPNIGDQVFDPKALRERRTFSEVAKDTDPFGTAKRLGVDPQSTAGEVINTAAGATTALVGAGADVFFPDPVTIVTFGASKVVRPLAVASARLAGSTDAGRAVARLLPGAEGDAARAVKSLSEGERVIDARPHVRDADTASDALEQAAKLSDDVGAGLAKTSDNLAKEVSRRVLARVLDEMGPEAADELIPMLKDTGRGLVPSAGDLARKVQELHELGILPEQNARTAAEAIRDALKAEVADLQRVIKSDVKAPAGELAPSGALAVASVLPQSGSNLAAVAKRVADEALKGNVVELTVDQTRRASRVVAGGSTGIAGTHLGRMADAAEAAGKDTVSIGKADLLATDREIRQMDVSRRPAGTTRMANQAEATRELVRPTPMLAPKATDNLFQAAARTMTRVAANIGKTVIFGGNELSDWEKAGLSKDVRDAALDAERRLDAVAADISKLKSESDVAAYLEGKRMKSDADTVLDGENVIAAFARARAAGLVDNSVGSQAVRALVDPASWDLVKGSDAGKEAVKKANEALSTLASASDLRRVEGAVTLALGPEVLAPVLDGAKRLASVVAGHAEMATAAERMFGRGVLVTEAERRYLELFSEARLPTAASDAGKLISSVPLRQAADVRLKVKDATALEPVKSARPLTDGLRLIDPGLASKMTDAEAESMEALHRLVRNETYIPTMVRERLAKKVDQLTAKASTPQGSTLLSMWKLGITRGSIAPKPGYFINNIAGNLEQVYNRFGLNTALQSAARSELSNILAVGVGGGQGLVAGAKSVALSALAGTERGKAAVNAIARLSSAAPEKVARLLNIGSMRLEVNKLLDGTDETLRVGNSLYTYKELREAAVRGGVYDGMDVAELGKEVSNLGKVFGLPAEGVAHIAETIGTRQRNGLYLTLLESGMKPDDAARGVREALYDYKNVLSEGDKNIVVKYLLPFWSWQKSANRQFIGAMFTPQGAYRIKKWNQAQKVAADWASSWAEDGDDVGILAARIPEGDPARESYTKYKNYREAVEKVSPDTAPTARQWNALLWNGGENTDVSGGKGNTSWMRASDVDPSLHLTQRDVQLLQAYVTPWYSEAGMKAYLRDRPQVRVGARTYEGDVSKRTDLSDAERQRVKLLSPTAGLPDTSAYWHLLVPPSGADGAISWGGNLVGAVLTQAVALGSSEAQPSALLVAQGAVDPFRAPQVGAVLSTLAGEKADTPVSEATAKTLLDMVPWLSSAIVPVSSVDPARARAGLPVGKTRWVIRDPVAGQLFQISAMAGLDRYLLRGEKGIAPGYRPENLRALLDGMGFGTADVGTTAAQSERYSTEGVESLLPMAREPVGNAPVMAPR